MKDFILLAIGLALLAIACWTDTFDCKQCKIYEANQTQINLTTEGTSK